MPHFEHESGHWSQVDGSVEVFLDGPLPARKADPVVVFAWLRKDCGHVTPSNENPVFTHQARLISPAGMATTGVCRGPSAGVEALHSGLTTVGNLRDVIPV
jgi:hypothetical protein